MITDYRLSFTDYRTVLSIHLVVFFGAVCRCVLKSTHNYGPTTNSGHIFMQLAQNAAQGEHLVFSLVLTKKTYMLAHCASIHNNNNSNKHTATK